MLDDEIVSYDQPESYLGLVLFLMEAVPNKRAIAYRRRARNTLGTAKSRKNEWCRLNFVN